jgi:RNA polymerase sigma-70 factor (ECF subfamily)
MDKQLELFERLYDTYADTIFRHIAYKLGDRERAKELTQEVFMKTWQYMLGGNTLTHEKAFLYRTAHNLFINEIRTDKRTASLSLLEDAGFEAVDAQAQGGVVAAERHELQEKLRHLKPSYREVLVLRYIDDLSVKEIAAILDEQETNISMRIKRGIEALRTIYNQPLS